MRVSKGAPAPRVTRAEQKARTRRELQEAAFELAQTRPLADLSVADIATAAGVSRRTFFNHFAVKEDAVLPDRLSVPAEAAAVFIAGGPSGDLIDDLNDLLRACVRAARRESIGADHAAKLTAMMGGNQAVMSAFIVRHAEFEAELQELTVRRLNLDGTAEPADVRRKAQLCALLVTAVLRSSWEEWMGADTHDFTDAGFRALREIFSGS